MNKTKYLLCIATVAIVTVFIVIAVSHEGETKAAVEYSVEDGDNGMNREIEELKNVVSHLEKQQNQYKKEIESMITNQYENMNSGIDIIESKGDGKDKEGSADTEMNENVKYTEDMNADPQKVDLKIVKTFDEAIDVEDYDDEWSEKHEDFIAQSFRQKSFENLNLESVVCKTSICRAEIALRDDVGIDDLDRFTLHAPWLDSEHATEYFVWRESYKDKNISVYVARKGNRLPKVNMH